MNIVTVAIAALAEVEKLRSLTERERFDLANLRIINDRARSRDATACQARWRVWRDLRAAGHSLAEIGRMAGYDHTTVLHGLRRIGAA